MGVFGEGKQGKKSGVRVAGMITTVNAEELSESALDGSPVSPSAVNVLRQEDPFDPTSFDGRAVLHIEPERDPLIVKVSREGIPALDAIKTAVDLVDEVIDLVVLGFLRRDFPHPEIGQKCVGQVIGGLQLRGVLEQALLIVRGKFGPVRVETVGQPGGVGPGGAVLDSVDDPSAIAVGELISRPTGHPEECSPFPFVAVDLLGGFELQGQAFVGMAKEHALEEEMVGCHLAAVCDAFAEAAGGMEITQSFIDSFFNSLLRPEVGVERCIAEDAVVCGACAQDN